MGVNRDFNQYFKNFTKLPFERKLEKYRLQKVLELINSDLVGKVNKILEVGPGLNPVFDNLSGYELVHVLEPINDLYQLNLSKLANTESQYIFNETLENFLKNSERCLNYDLIILSSVLHEIPDYQKALEACHSLLDKNGNILIVVPNNQSIHRIIGAQKGLHPTGAKLTDTELTMQQSVSFSVESARNEIEMIGFETIQIKTEFIKIFPHAVMQELLNQSILNTEILTQLILKSFQIKFICLPMNQ